MKLNVRKLAVTSARAVIGFGLAGYLLYLTLRSTGADLVGELAAADPRLLALVFLLHAGMVAVGVWRWHLLLRVQGIPIAFRDTARLNMIGMFFNLVVPGAVGGDLFKMGFLARLTPGKRTESVFSIVVDRLLGMFGLFAVAGVTLLFSRHYVAALGTEYRVIAWAIGCGSLGGGAAAVLLEFHHVLLEHRRLQPLWEIGARRLPRFAVETARRLVSALDSYRRARRILALAMLMSLAIHTTLAVEVFLIGKAMHESRLSLRQYFVTTQIANAIASIPIAPGGVGQRDKGAQAFFAAFGMDTAKSGAIPVTLTLLVVFWGVVGAGVLIFSPAIRSLQSGAPPADGKGVAGEGKPACGSP